MLEGKDACLYSINLLIQMSIKPETKLRPSHLLTLLTRQVSATGPESSPSQNQQESESKSGPVLC